MIDKFEVGKYYRWIGPDEDFSAPGLPFWRPSKRLIRDGKPRRCLLTEQKSDSIRVRFDGIEEDSGYSYCYSEEWFKYFEEATESFSKSYEKEVLEFKSLKEIRKSVLHQIKFD